MKLLRTFLLFALIFCIAGIFAQTKPSTNGQESTRKISGVVMEENGDQIIGANVLIKGTKVGTITDVNGKFSILAKPSDKIVVTYIGFLSQEVDVKSKTSLSIILNVGAKSIDEVVVVGYGSVKKSDLTTSVSKIDSRAIKDRPITNLTDALTGQLAGIQTQVTSGVPGEDVQITIRGNSSLDAASSPLFVIDGVISETIGTINPSDVESVQVLKDAASTAIYGARGSAGVILVETKKAKEGMPTIKFDSYVGFQQIDKMPQVMSPKEWYAYNIFYINANYLSKDSKNSMAIPNKLRPSGDQIPQAWLLNPMSDTPDWKLNPSLPMTDWIGAIMNPNAMIQSYQLSIASRVKDKSTLNISGGYLSQDGIVKFTGFQRVNFRINGNVNLSKKLIVEYSIAPTLSLQNRAEAEGKDRVIMNALIDPPSMPINKGTRDLGFDNSSGNQNTVNPYERLKSVTETMNIITNNTTISAEYKLHKSLVFKTTESFNFRNSVYEFFAPANVQPPTSPISNGSSYGESFSNWAVQNVLTYNNKFAKKHNLNIMLGQSIDNRLLFRSDLAATSFPLESVTTLNQGAIPSLSKTSKSESRTSSFFSRLNYSLMNKYLFSASIRADGSSRFGPNHRWGYFPSVSGGWKINEENFMKKIDQISLLKFRASWGLAGNDRIGYNDYLSMMSVTNGVYGGTAQTAVYPTNLANPDLKWESTEALNVGFDLSLFKNRVQLNLDYYRNVTRDMLYNLKVPSTTGFQSMRTNFASLENSGIELDLTTLNISSKNFQWSTSLNASKNNNKILNLGENDDIISEQWGAYFLTKVGSPISQFYMFKTDGFLTSKDFGVGSDGKYDKTQPLTPIISGQIPGNPKFIDSNNDGKIDNNDRVPYGSNLPDLVYGMTNRFTYKSFELSIFLQGQFGGQLLYLASRNMNTGRRTNNSLDRWLNCYKETYAGGDPVPYELGVDMAWDGVTPMPYGFGQSGVNGTNDTNTITEDKIYDATYLRLKNVSLSYSNSNVWVRKLGIRMLKVYASIENLYTFTNYIGNPDANTFNPSNPILRGVDYSSYPTTKKLTIGLTANF
jgi:TonB-linked SusC/RagA family outer membrane protein